MLRLSRDLVSRQRLARCQSSCLDHERDRETSLCNGYDGEIFRSWRTYTYTLATPAIRDTTRCHRRAASTRLVNERGAFRLLFVIHVTARAIVRASSHGPLNRRSPSSSIISKLRTRANYRVQRVSIERSRSRLHLRR